MSRNRVTIAVDEELIFVRGWRVQVVLREAGMKPMFSARHGGYMLDAERLPDVLAAFEHRAAPTVVEHEERVADQHEDPVADVREREVLNPNFSSASSQALGDEGLWPHDGGDAA